MFLITYKTPNKFMSKNKILSPSFYLFKHVGGVRNHLAGIPSTKRGILHRIRSKFLFHLMGNLDRSVVFIYGIGIIPKGGHIRVIVAKAVQKEYRHKLDYAF
jgi:hypothetical protein